MKKVWNINYSYTLTVITVHIFSGHPRSIQFFSVDTDSLTSIHGFIRSTTFSNNYPDLSP